VTEIKKITQATVSPADESTFLESSSSRPDDDTTNKTTQQSHTSTCPHSMCTTNTRCKHSHCPIWDL